MRSTSSPKNGFTLIELLVVITIIGILAGLAFPAINGALDAAKKAEAAAMINQLRVAMTAYSTEYGNLPPSVGSETQFNAGALYQTLIGRDTPAGNNPRQIVFMEFNSKVLRVAASDKVAPVDPSTATLFVDPWNFQYQAVFDINYDNTITVPGGTANALVAIWSTGKPVGGGQNTDNIKFIKSWK